MYNNSPAVDVFYQKDCADSSLYGYGYCADGMMVHSALKCYVDEYVDQ